MPAHRKAARAIILQVPSTNPYSEAKGKAVTTTKNQSEGSNSQTQANNNNNPLVGNPIDGGTKLASAPSIPSSSSLQVPISSTINPSVAVTTTTTTTAIGVQDPSSSSSHPTSTLASSTTITATPTELEEAQASAAQWNSLLIWARKRRGPQWDAATGMWQVDRDSQEYYSFSSDPSKGVDPTPEQSLQRTAGGNEEEGSPPPIGPGTGKTGRGRWKRDKANSGASGSLLNQQGMGIPLE